MLAVAELFQAPGVQELHGAPGELDHALALEPAEHPGDHLPGGSQVGGDLLVGDLQGGGLLDPGFLHQKARQSLVEALPHDLLHEPHDLGEVVGDEGVGVIGEGQALVHEVLVQTRGDDPDLRVLLRLDEHVEHHVGHDAGRGKQADIHIKEPADGDLPALLVEQVRPELAGLHQDHALALGAAIVDHGAPGDLL